ncbi:unnamed protein product [Clonostachys rosea f. rosea IK726]|uniref:BZIP domain-containing protein n=2 Tax=Bionectria ochroleuca TaxID=29856 RepID=A0A0B7KCW9_BIOOC|nr:unnamed protein product [Clonostachys rosea f. rosea IK726]
MEASSTSSIPGSGSSSEHVQSAATDAERKHRKRVLNRMNQRARRDRMRGDQSKKNIGSSKFETNRWRVDEFELLEVPQPIHGFKEKGKTKPAKIHNHKHDNPLILSKKGGIQLPSVFHSLSLAQVEQHAPQFSRWARSQSSMLSASPCSDQLLSLVNYNTFRGLFINKAMLATLSEHFPPGSNTAVNIMKGLPGQATVIPSSPDIPTSLVPTRQQMRVPHATWMDFIPFPQMRDKLIRHNDEFDHRQFIRDMVGDLLDELYFLRPSVKTSPPGTHNITIQDGLDDQITATRNGLIIWGDPHIQDSWEATPGFFKRWGWVLQGCGEIVKSTNYWRSLRSEEPIVPDLYRKEEEYTVGRIISHNDQQEG